MRGNESYNGPAFADWRKEVNRYMLFLLILLVLIFAVVPTWPYSRGWGYYPSGGLGLVALILLILVLAGRI